MKLIWLAWCISGIDVCLAINIWQIIASDLHWSIKVSSGATMAVAIAMMGNLYSMIKEARK